MKFLIYRVSLRMQSTAQQCASSHRFLKIVHSVCALIAALLSLTIVAQTPGYNPQPTKPNHNDSPTSIATPVDFENKGPPSLPRSKNSSVRNPTANQEVYDFEQTAKPQPTPLLTYPAPYFSSHNIVPGLVASNENQMTSLVPDQSQIYGVVLLLYWSVIEPKPGVYNWGIINRAIRYWRARNKKIVLAPVAYGAPVVFSGGWGGGGLPQNGLPSWLIRGHTLHAHSRTLPSYPEVILGSTRTSGVKVPIPWDPVFQIQYARFIRELGLHYNGNSTIAFVRIGVGKEGEEEYPIDCPSELIPQYVCTAATKKFGWTPARWYRSAIQITREYLAAFSHTRLSLDFGLTNLFYDKRLPQYFQYHSQAALLLDYCSRNGIILGYDGLDDQTLSALQGAHSAISALPQILELNSRLGHPVALEAIGPLYNPNMTNPSKILQSVLLVHPKYINFFGDLFGMIAYLNGSITPTTRASWQQYDHTLGASQGLSNGQIRARAALWVALIDRL